MSRAGARGYMQVMPFWVDLIGTASTTCFTCAPTCAMAASSCATTSTSNAETYAGAGALQRQPGQGRVPQACHASLADPLVMAFNDVSAHLAEDEAHAVYGRG